jgi:hypothetical protein
MMFRIGKGKSKGKDDKRLGQAIVGGRGPTRAQEKIAKKILGKDTGRHVFGFACSPDIHAKMKMLASELQVPIFALGEHCLQLSTGLIDKAKENAEERETLRRHLIEHHVEQRTIEKFNWYDEELAKEMREDLLSRFEIDRVVHQLVVNFVRKGMNPKYMAYYLDYGYRCFVAFINGWPMPKPQKGRFSSRPQSPDNQTTEEKGNGIDNDSSEHSG